MNGGVYSPGMRFWTRLGLMILLTVLTVGGVKRLRLDTDILGTLPADLPEATGLRILRDGFSGGDELLVGLVAPDAETAATSVAALGEHLRRVSHLVRSVEWAGTLENPDTAAALLAWALQNAPPDRIARLESQLGPGKLAAHLERVLEKLASSPDPAEVQRWSYDPLGLLDAVDLGGLTSMDDAGFSAASADGTVRLLLVAPKEKLTGYKRASAWMAELQGEILKWQNAGDDSRHRLQFLYTGEPSFMAETGSGIERDLSGTIGVATVLIAALFWFMFRRWKMLLWIQVLLALVVLFSLALGGWALGELSIMSLGFASILLGIAVDYAVFILQEGMDHPHLSAAELRRSALPPIFGGACTTATVFLALLFSGLPGLADMGLMVALGVMAGFAVMVLIMPELVVRGKVRPTVLPVRMPVVSPRGGVLATGGVLLVMVGVFTLRGFPAFQSSSAVLRPAHSQSMAGWERLQQALGKPDQAAVPLIATSPDWQSARERMAPAVKALDQARRDGLVRQHSLPVALLPDAAAQGANRSRLVQMASQKARLNAAVLEAGFTEDALQLSDRALAVLEKLGQGDGEAQPLPSEPVAAGVVGRFFNPDATQGGSVLLGSVSFVGEPGSPDLAKLEALSQRLVGQDVHLAGWETLGPSLSARIKKDLTRLMLPLLLVLALMLALTFRNLVDFALCMLMLLMGIAALAATMALLGQSWNLANVASLPLLLGLGIDYGIHMLLAMKRDHNDISKVWATTGRAVFFCGVTTIIGFMSLVFASNGGVASLGIACSVGSLWTLVFALWLLPHWRAWLGGNRDGEGAGPTQGR